MISGARPYFDVIVRTGTLAPEELTRVRLGMSARLDITVYQSASALVVPATAIRRSGAGAVVFRRGPEGKPEPVTVTTGAVLPDVVEIRTGLNAGDVVATHAKAVP